MSRKADEGWVRKNGKPVHIPPYKTPRQKTSKGKDETRVSETVIEVLDSEGKGKGVVVRKRHNLGWFGEVLVFLRQSCKTVM